MKYPARTIRFRPNQNFFLNVDGKIEQYKFVRATYTYNGSVAIVAKCLDKSTMLMTLTAERGLVKREFKKVEKGGTYGNCCIFSSFDRSRSIVHWCGIYFSRRAAKKGISTTDLWKHDYQEVIAEAMSAHDRDLEAMLRTVRVNVGGAVDAMLIDDLTGMRERVTFQPSVKLKDLMNAAVTTTHHDTKVPTYNDLKEMAERLKKPLDPVLVQPRDSWFWPTFEIRKNPQNIINIKGGV